MHISPYREGDMGTHGIILDQYRISIGSGSQYVHIITFHLVSKPFWAQYLKSLFAVQNDLNLCHFGSESRWKYAKTRKTLKSPKTTQNRGISGSVLGPNLGGNTPKWLKTLK